MVGFKVRLPKVAAIEMNGDGAFHLIEYVCGCRIVRQPVQQVGKPVQWEFVARCPQHLTIIPASVGAKMPEWWGP